MIYLTKQEADEEGVTYSLAIKFTPNELAQGRAYFDTHRNDINKTYNPLEYVKEVGILHGLQAELSMLRDMVFEAECRTQTPVSTPKAKRKLKRLSK